MNQVDVQKDISDLIVNAFPRALWLNIQDVFHAKYEAAQQVTMGSALKLDGPGQLRLRPQIRHYTLNAAFKEAALSCGVIHNSVETSPKGEHFVVLSSAGVKMSRIGLNYDEPNIKGAKYRTLLAELNEGLEGYTPDLFSERTIDHGPTGTLGVLILNINPPYHEPQSRMLDLRVVVPFSNLKGFHFNWSLTQLLERYTGEQKIIIPDNVLPTLKRHLKDQEN
ncbi:hypothetical protein DN756_19960 [Yersinia pseudotuberculosis]|uniref:Uncharacterized protein n=1 Tax=Yersinia pseudotuberculosis serotype O:3 (strain YPIII) TaxID=502800 RepID=A0A0H3B8K4_YERPY|nr:hypothetical protein [Yersinia pseudotuberculosis]AYW85877.1 hypothetical protein EGX87_00760 [Yersinia pseudotuberculosis]AYX00516.1 hypothetical protein EGX53_11965 [Yersinia pseudotuberculosis]AZA32081.1 hypothetical protein DN756_19960 [Yersinia pseudotuberculosis]MBK1423049.1 hypothetical protein [Yersinia pseudotuberculosis]